MRTCRGCRRSSMYQRCINPACTGSCCLVRLVSASPASPQLNGTIRHQPTRRPASSASRGSWVRVLSSPPGLPGTTRPRRFITTGCGGTCGGTRRRQVEHPRAQRRSRVRVPPPQICAGRWRTNSPRSSRTAPYRLCETRQVTGRKLPGSSVDRPQAEPHVGRYRERLRVHLNVTLARSSAISGRAIWDRRR